MGSGWVFPRHSWLRAPDAVPRHSWLGARWCWWWVAARHSWLRVLGAVPRHSFWGPLAAVVWCTVLERGHYYVVAATATSPGPQWLVKGTDTMLAPGACDRQG